jgi:hypothetical protein
MVSALLRRTCHANNKSTYASVDTTTQNRLTTLETGLLEHQLVVLKTVKLSFILVAITTNESTTAFSAAEVLGMHVLSLQNNPFS